MVEYSAAEKREFSRLRSFLVEPSEVWLETDTETHRLWLTDRYVMIDITDSSVAGQPGLPDGPYKLTAGKGFVASGVFDRAPLNVHTALIRAEKDAQWRPVVPTSLSVVENKAKAMLVYVETAGVKNPDDKHAPEATHPRFPYALNEELWTAFHDAYDNNPRESKKVLFEKDPFQGKKHPFRVRLTWRSQDKDWFETLAYIAGVSLGTDNFKSVPDVRKLAQIVVNAI